MESLVKQVIIPVSGYTVHTNQHMHDHAKAYNPDVFRNATGERLNSIR